VLQRRPPHRPSSVDRLPPEIKRLIMDLRIEHGLTIDQIRERLLELGQQISRSALARHTRTMEDVAEDIRLAKETAKAVAGTSEHGEEDELFRLNMELANVELFRFFTAAREGKPLEHGALMAASVALEKLTNTLARLQQVAERAEKRATEKLMKKVNELAKKQENGLTATAVLAIRHAVLGSEA
jgi:hypothetical protein